MLTTTRLCVIYIIWIVVSGCIYLQSVQGAPFLSLLLSQPLNWTATEEKWDFKSLQRSTAPFMELRNFVNRSHDAPAESDKEFMERLIELRAEITSTPRPSRPMLLSDVLKIFNSGALSYDIENGVLPCIQCRFVAQTLLFKIKIGRSDEEIIKAISDFCTTLNIQSPSVCQGIAKEFAKEIIYVLRRVKFNSMEICNFIFGDTCPSLTSSKFDWDIELPIVDKPPIASELPIPKEGAPFFKVLHLTDYHYDPKYKEGSNAKCNEPLCCQASSGRPANPEAAAGKWGDWKCDSPKRLIENMLNHIAETHTDIDYIIWTGDLPSHDVWNQSKTSNLEIIKETVKQLDEKFPGAPIFPALGNHESFPVNSFPTPYVNDPSISISWLYDELAKQWQRWLPETASNTVQRGAFYSVLVRPGFRIISLNMNYCNNLNWWLVLNSTDPTMELEWLIYELQNAEVANENVHIIGHIPPGIAECLKVWSRNFYKIISRFESTITAQFYGHTHYDEFELFYDPNNLNRPTNIAYIGPSVSPHVNLNPGYRIYYVDGDHDETSRLVIDHETWIMDLQKANRDDNPIWHKLYTARGAFNMTALRPQDWNDLVKRMANDQALFDLYYTFYWKNSPVRPSCDQNCRKRLLCDCKNGRSHDRRKFCSDSRNGFFIL